MNQKQRRFSACIAALIVLLLAAPTRASSASCTPQFPYAQGWLGGDGAYSISLNAGRVLWLFEDSFVSDTGHASRTGAKLLANTVAISTCANSHWDIRYYYYGKPHASGSPQAFFDSGTDRYRFWPLDGFVRDGSLYVFLVEITATGNGPFAFKPIGVKLAKVANPGADPHIWSVRYLDLSSDSQIVPGVSVVISAPYVYLYAVVDRGAPRTHHAILARIGLDHLDSPASIEYLDMAGTWKSGLDERNAQIIIADTAPEFSVRFHPEIARWVMVETDPRFPSRQIEIRTADRLEGPWSSFRPLYNIPGMQAASSAHDEDIFCYGAKEHLELASSPNPLSITYVCNSLSFERQTRDLSLYRPLAIALQLR